MYSGGESTDSQKYTQWAMNPSAFQNAGKDVDWAALAQQWIIMKEAGPPPIPGESQQEKSKVPEESEEGGEAEMDVDEKDDPPDWNPSAPEDAPPAPGAEVWTNWNPSSSGQNWNNWSNNWNQPSGVPPPIKPPLLPTPPPPTNLFAGPVDGGSDNAVPYGSKGYNTTAPNSNSFNTQPAFWTGMAVGKVNVTQTEIKPHNKRYSKVNVPTKVTIITPPSGSSAIAPLITDPPASSPTLPTLDANKRKQLPAWIREGLEKMERDKQRQLEREKELQAKSEYDEKMKLEEKEKMELLKTTMKERNMLKKSRFDSDHEQSGEDERVKTIKVTPPPSLPLTQEELMMKVRKTMTEILLRVTNEMIQETCQEERQRYLKKSRATNHHASAPSGAVIRNKLGLGVYDEGSSSDESEREDPCEDQSDSDLELRDSIKRRQSAFSKTEQEIEDRLAEVDKRKRGSPSRSRSSSAADSHDDQSQVEANTQDNRYNDDHNKRRDSQDDRSTMSSRRRVSPSSSESSRRNSRSRSGSHERKRDSKRRSRSVSTVRSSKRGRSVESYRRGSSEGRKRSRRSRSRSGSRYSKRSRRSRSRSRSSYSSRKSSKRYRYSSRKTPSRSRSRDRRKYDRKRSRRSRSRSRRSRSDSSDSSHRKRSRRSRSGSRRSGSSSRGKRSHRR